MKRFLSFVLALVLLAGVLPCTALPVFASSEADIEIPHDELQAADYVLSVTVTPEKQKVKKGDSFTFHAEVEGTISDVSWEVSGANSSSTYISSSGKLYVAAGETATYLTVTARSTFNEAKYDEATVEVVDYDVYVTRVTISPKTASVKCGDYFYFEATVEGTDYDDLIWTVSGNADDGTYAGDAYLRVSKYETASTLRVRATSARNTNKYDEAVITVLPYDKITDLNLVYDENAVVVSTHFTGSEVTQMLLGAIDYEATGDMIYYDTGSYYTCLSKNVSVSDGRLYETKLGSSDELLNTEDEYYLRFEIQSSGTYGWDPANPPNITVNGEAADIVHWNGELEPSKWLYVFKRVYVDDNADYVQSVTVTPEKQRIKKGNSFTFTADVDGTVPTVTWEVSGNNSSGTYINSSGKLTVAAGETAGQLTVIARSTFNPLKYAEATVEVVDYDVYVSKVTISPKSVSVKCGDYFYFEAEVEGTDYGDLIWTLSGNEDDGTYVGDAYLRVSKYETASTLRVRATSARDSNKYDEAVITVLPYDRITDVDIVYDESAVVISTAFTGSEVTQMLLGAIDYEATGDMIYYDTGSYYTCLSKNVSVSDGRLYETKLGSSSDLLNEEDEYYLRFEIQSNGTYGWDPSNPPTITVNGEAADIVHWNGELEPSKWLYVFKRVYVIESGNYWQISFDPNGGSGNMAPRLVEKTEGGYTDFIVPECTFTAPEGKVFAYWYTDAWPNEEWMSSDRLPVGSDICLKAIWFEEVKSVYANIPVAYAGAYAENNLDLFGSGEPDKYYINGGEWCYRNAGGTYMDFDGGQFQINQVYYVWLAFETEEGYYFAVDDEGSPAIEHYYVNGREVEPLPGSVDCSPYWVEFMIAYKVTSYEGEVAVTAYPEGAFTKVNSFTGNKQYMVSGSTVTVNCDSACKVGYWDGEKYVAIPASDNHNGTYSFDASGHGEVVLVVTGDAGLTGQVRNSDATKIKSYLKTGTGLNGVQLFAADVDGNGQVRNSDATKIKAFLKGNTGAISW